MVVHLSGDQPMLADIDSLPTSADSCLVCTNLRSLDGRKPIFIDRIDSVFLIPLQVVRFVEIPRRAVTRSGVATAVPEMGVGGLDAGSEVAPSVRSDGWLRGEEAVKGVALEDSPGSTVDVDGFDDLDDLEPDEDLLRRIREA